MIQQLVTETSEYRKLLDQLRAGARVISISGLVAGAARALAVAALQRDSGNTFAVVSQTTRDLEPWERDLHFWYCALHGKDTAAGEILVLPASETDPYAGVSPHPQTLERRALALWQLQQRSPSFVLLNARALARKTVSPATIAKNGAVLRRDEDYSPEALVEKLMATGYVREDPVGAVGEFSVRGGIIDIWPPGREAPVRVEFFGDTVDSLREFDPENQLSTSQIRVVEVPPMHEFWTTALDFQLWSEAARERWNDERFTRSLRDRTAFADEGEAFAGWEWLIPISIDCNATVFEHLGDAVLVVDEPGGIESYLSEFYERLVDRFREIDQADDIALRPDELFLSDEELRGLVEQRQRVELRTLGRAAAETDLNLKPDAEQPKVQIGREREARRPVFVFPIAATAFEVEWQAQSAMRYYGRIIDLVSYVKKGAEEKRTTLFVMPSLGVAERISEILSEYNVDTRLALTGDTSDVTDARPVVITVGRLSSGFELPKSWLIVHVESDVFDETADTVERRGAVGDTRKEGRKRRSKTAAFLSDFRDLKPNDYVVHIDHGVARFGGLQTLYLRQRSEALRARRAARPGPALLERRRSSTPTRSARGLRLAENQS